MFGGPMGNPRRFPTRRLIDLVGPARPISYGILTTTIPDLSMQREFARRASAIGDLRVPGLASLARLDALFASLQHRAFRGEL
jgi:hypothetical protein